LHVLHPWQFLMAILDRPPQPPHATLSGPLVFDMLEDLLISNINAEHTELSMQPSNAIVAVVVGGNHPPSLGS
jgi:hypothetical protein